MRHDQGQGRSARALAAPGFLLLWGGESVSDFGTALGGVVPPLGAVVGLSAGAVEVGVLAAAQWLPPAHAS